MMAGARRCRHGSARLLLAALGVATMGWAPLVGCRHVRPTGGDEAREGASAAATRPERLHPAPRHKSVPRVPADNARIVTALDQEWLAANSNAAWLDVGEGRYAAAYVAPTGDPLDDVVYVFPELRGDL